MGGQALGSRDEAPPHTQESVMTAGDKFLDQDCARVCLAESQREMGTDGAFILQIDSDTASLAAIDRFNHDWITDLARNRCAAVFRRDTDGRWHGETTVAQQVAGQFLVGGDFRRDKAVGGDIGCPDALLESAVSQLHQRESPACSTSGSRASPILIKVLHRNASRFGFLSQLARVDTKAKFFSQLDQFPQLFREVKLRVAFSTDERFHHANSQLAGGDADFRLFVLEDEVRNVRRCPIFLIVHRMGFAIAHFLPSQNLKLEGDVLGDVKYARALSYLLEESSRLSDGAAMFTQRRNGSGQLFTEAWDHVGGPFPEVPAVKHKANYRDGCPVVSAAIDLCLENLHATWLMLREQELCNPALSSIPELLPGGGRRNFRRAAGGDTAVRISPCGPEVLRDCLLQQHVLAPEQQPGRRAGRCSADAR